MDDKNCVRPLNSKNYQQWKFDIRALLKFRGLLPIVEGRLAEPSLTGSNQAEVEEWHKKDTRAVFTIASCLDEETHASIRDCETSAEVWEKVTGLNEKSSDTNKYLLNQEFHKFAFVNGMTVASYCSGLAVICQKLQAVKEDKTEASIIAKIINDLPVGFDNFRQSYRIAAASGMGLSMKDLQQQLQVVEDDLKEKSNSDAVGDALVVQRKKFAHQSKFKSGKDNPVKNQGRAKMSCYHCGKLGHFKRNCLKLKKEKAANVNLENEHVGFVSIIHSANQQCTIWVADSGATSHMTRHGTSFNKLVKFAEPEHIVIGDGRKILAVGKGEIAVDVFNGKTWIRTVLHDVLYVPELGEPSLFSIGAATDRGHQTLMTRDTVEISYNSKTVLTGARKNGNLYVLNICTVNGGVNNTSVYNDLNSIHSAQLAKGSLQLWHERLAHISPDTVMQMAKEGG